MIRNIRYIRYSTENRKEILEREKAEGRDVLIANEDGKTLDATNQYVLDMNLEYAHRMEEFERMMLYQDGAQNDFLREEKNIAVIQNLEQEKDLTIMYNENITKDQIDRLDDIVNVSDSQWGCDVGYTLRQELSHPRELREAVDISSDRNVELLAEKAADLYMKSCTGPAIRPSDGLDRNLRGTSYSEIAERNELTVEQVKERTVDLAITPYDNLPEHWKEVNRESARNMIELMPSLGGPEEILRADLDDRNTQERIGTAIHEAWLQQEANSWARGGDLDKPYIELPVEEQQKDIDQVRAMQDWVKDITKDLERIENRELRVERPEGIAVDLKSPELIDRLAERSAVLYMDSCTGPTIRPANGKDNFLRGSSYETIAQANGLTVEQVKERTVDLSITHFQDLPEHWKNANRESSRNLVDLMPSLGDPGDILSLDLDDPRTQEKVGTIIHDAWLRQESNSWARGGSLDKPYIELPVEEQQKDINQMRAAQGWLRDIERAVERAEKDAREIDVNSKMDVIKDIPEKQVPGNISINNDVERVVVAASASAAPPPDDPSNRNEINLDSPHGKDPLDSLGRYLDLDSPKNIEKLAERAADLYMKSCTGPTIRPADGKDKSLRGSSYETIAKANGLTVEQVREKTVDLSVTPYRDLPEHWKQVNLDSARGMIELIQPLGGTVAIMNANLDDPQVQQRMGAAIHEAWLQQEANSWARGGPLDKPFAELPPEEQKKDIDQLRAMQGWIRDIERTLERPEKDYKEIDINSKMDIIKDIPNQHVPGNISIDKYPEKEVIAVSAPAAPPTPPPKGPSGGRNIDLEIPHGADSLDSMGRYLGLDSPENIEKLAERAADLYMKSCTGPTIRPADGKDKSLRGSSYETIAKANGLTVEQVREKTVDLSVTPYRDLPEHWKQVNLDSARGMIELIQPLGGTAEIMNANLDDPQVQQRMGAAIHEAWLQQEANSWARGGPLDKPFAELPPEEQKKDIDQLRAMQGWIKDVFIERGHQLEAERTREQDRQMINKDFNLDKYRDNVVNKDVNIDKYPNNVNLEKDNLNPSINMDNDKIKNIDPDILLVDTTQPGIDIGNIPEIDNNKDSHDILPEDPINEIPNDPDFTDNHESKPDDTPPL